MNFCDIKKVNIGNMLGYLDVPLLCNIQRFSSQFWHYVQWQRKKQIIDALTSWAKKGSTQLLNM